MKPEECVRVSKRSVGYQAEVLIGPGADWHRLGNVRKHEEHAQEIANLLCDVIQVNIDAAKVETIEQVLQAVGKHSDCIVSTVEAAIDAAKARGEM